MSAIFDSDRRPEPGDGVTLQGLRVPPHSVEAEQSVLGGLLIDNRAWELVGEQLTAPDFYRVEHQLVFAAIKRLAVNGMPADVVTVFDALGPKQETVGGLAYINALAQSVPSAANIRRYTEIVRSRSVQRQVAALALDLQGRVAGTMEGADIMSAVDAVVTGLLALMQGTQTREPVLLSDIMLQLIDEVQALAEGKSPAISTGLTDLDEATAGGGRPGECWVIGARPSMGKSAWVLTVCLCITAAVWGLVLTQEDSLLTLAQRAVANLGRVNLADLRNPRRARDENALWSGLSEGVDKAQSLKMLVDDQGGLSLADVRRKVQQAKRRAALEGGELRVVVIDYLQLMTGENSNRNQLLGEISNGLKALAKEMGVWVILLSQLSRKADERQGLPDMSHLRDSGDIEGAADVIVLLHREARRKPTEANKYWAQAEIAKNKNGATKTVDLFFDGAHQRFANWDGPPPKGVGNASEGKGGGLN